jgi:hypothetical protein
MAKDFQEQTEYQALDSDNTDTTADIHTAPKRRWLPALFWLWECMAAIASAACMTAVVAILIRMESQPLEQWKLRISLNATIAIFIIVAKLISPLVIAACIAQSKWVRFKSSARRVQELDLFDNASRGPSGALVLLSRVRWGLASVGAVAKVLAIGVDTFAQQVIRFDTRKVEVPGNDQASFALSHAYSGGANRAAPLYRSIAGEYILL